MAGQDRSGILLRCADDDFSLDDKRQPVETNNLPDLVAQWKTRRQTRLDDRTQKAFRVDVQEIRDKGNYDLSINRYKKTVHQEEQYDPPTEILERVMDLERDIMQDLKELKTLLEKEHAS
ncbi:MAG: hypothetical protein HQL83_15545 [Magnetococcales bacterium]|nr:hypothetical protein [Magnetococcales bacterium]MBF0631766.1 hypothetical protein [Magnetococcales bacterium]